jgi:hypothetical protein
MGVKTTHTLPLPVLILATLTLATTACTTLQNRRDLYFAQTVRGPYTRLLNHLIGKPKQGSVGSSSKTSEGKSFISQQKW